MDSTAYPSCNDGEAVLANELAIARWDVNPVTPGHILIVTRRHAANLFETAADEGRALLAFLQETKDLCSASTSPTASMSASTLAKWPDRPIPHVHIHLVPRYRGDTPQPRGGVRSVICAKQSD